MLRKRPRFILSALLGLAGGLFGTSCGHEGERIRLTNSDSGRTIAVRAGTTFDIALDVPVGPFY
jgi:hypothetical protein